MKRLNPLQGTNRTNTTAIAISEDNYVLFLTANVEQTITVPAGANIVSIVSTGLFYMGVGGTAIDVPTVSGVTLLEVNPSVRLLEGVTTLRFITGSSTTIGVSFYE